MTMASDDAAVGYGLGTNPAWQQAALDRRQRQFEDLLASGPPTWLLERLEESPSRRTAIEMMEPPLPSLGKQLRDLAGEIHAELDRWGVYDEPEDTDPYWRRVVGLCGLRMSYRAEFERWVRHADLLDKWPVQDDWPRKG